MNSLTLPHLPLDKQDRQEVRPKMNKYAFERVLHNVIREHGKYDGIDYTVSLKDIDLHEMKLILSYVLDSIEDYEIVIKSETCINETFDEHADEILRLIEKETATVYREDMEEMGMMCGRRYERDENYGVRR